MNVEDTHVFTQFERTLRHKTFAISFSYVLNFAHILLHLMLEGEHRTWRAFPCS